MANPKWIKGGSSPNPEGRRKMRHSAKTIKGMVERFLKRNMTTSKLQSLYNELPAQGKVNLLTELMPYALPKQPTQVDMSIEKLDDKDLNTLYLQVMEGVQTLPQAFAAPLLIPETITNDKQQQPNEPDRDSY